MARDVLELKNVGPINRAEVHFGDLTVLVGPQAAGKTVFLEFLKLLVDQDSVFSVMQEQGLNWNGRWDEFLNLYLGEGMSRVWKAHSEWHWRGKLVDVAEFARRGTRKPGVTQCFFIPAQRALTLGHDGWPRRFSDYRPGDPYVVREFSENLRLVAELATGSAPWIFPFERHLPLEIRRLVESTILAGFHIGIERGRQKRLILGRKESDSSLPFMVWSAGQREFVPLLLGRYYVSRETKESQVKWVVIEELEIGLHPRGISVMLLVVLDLLRRGYRVCLSTHSPHVLDLVWALRVFREHKAPRERVLDLFDVTHTRAMIEVAESALQARTKVFYFDPESKAARDISDLDPGSRIAEEAGWGGLTEFSGRVGDEVARVVADAK